MDTLRFWLALHRAPDIGAVAFNILLDEFSTPAALFERDFPRHLLPPALRDYLAKPDWKGVERDLQWLQQSPQCHILTRDDPRYPRRLYEIPRNAPCVLFVRGSVEALTMHQIAIVGTRKPTPVGIQTARTLAQDLTASGINITSGLALGIDTAAHQGALLANGRTIAVLGTGINRIYPTQNRQLAEEILGADGVLVTEFPIDTPPLPRNFPQRNRIISGLTLGVLVIEAAERSGSLITAKFALEQGREVFAVPGSVHNNSARGCHALIKQGAKLVERADDIIEEIGVFAGLPRSNINEREWGVTGVKQDSGLSRKHELVYNQIGYEPTPVDSLIERTGIPAGELCALLIEMEVEGKVVTTDGGLYMRQAQRGTT